MRYNVLTVKLQSVIREMRSGSCPLWGVRIVLWDIKGGARNVPRSRKARETKFSDDGSKNTQASANERRSMARLPRARARVKIALRSMEWQGWEGRWVGGWNRDWKLAQRASDGPVDDIAAVYRRWRDVIFRAFYPQHTDPFNGPCPGLPGSAGTRKVKPIWILLEQETVSGSGISWAVCKCAPRSRQITTIRFFYYYFYYVSLRHNGSKDIQFSTHTYSHTRKYIH